MDSAAAKFLGAYSPDYISEELLEVTRAHSLVHLDASIAQNPEVDSLLNLACIEYLDFELITASGE